MIKLRDFMAITDYHLTMTNRDKIACYGDDSITLHVWNDSEYGEATITAVMDTLSSEIYELCAVDGCRDKAYRWIRPDLRETAAVQYANRYSAVEWIEIETETDILEKARAIYAHQPYDTRISVPVTLPDDALASLMMMAHNQDITLNQLVQNIIREQFGLEEHNQVT